MKIILLIVLTINLYGFGLNKKERANKDVTPICKFGYQFIVIDGVQDSMIIQVYERDRYQSNPPQPMKCKEK